MYNIYIDEAGRGPLAGPVYVGIIIENATKKGHTQFFKKYKGCYDSKTLSEEQREHIYSNIISHISITYASGSASAAEIDKHGIVRGIRTSIARAVWKHFVGGKFSLSGFTKWIAKDKSQMLLVIDGKTDFRITKLRGVKVETIIKGDSKVPMISAASIVAKVERDRVMRKYAKTYSAYGFDKHKGYGTKAHYAAIEANGPSKIHRMSFLRTIGL